MDGAKTLTLMLASFCPKVTVMPSYITSANFSTDGTTSPLMEQVTRGCMVEYQEGKTDLFYKKRSVFICILDMMVGQQFLLMATMLQLMHAIILFYIAPVKHIILHKIALKKLKSSF